MSFAQANDQPGLVRAGQRAFLRLVLPDDYEPIRLLEQSGPDIINYRARGSTHAPESFSASLWHGVLAQFIVGNARTGNAAGIVAAYSADFRNQHCKVAGQVRRAERRNGVGAEGFFLFFDYLFDAFPFRKLYMDVLEPNLTQFANLRLLPLEEEGVLRDHELADGGTWDLHLLSLRREVWREYRTEDVAAGRASVLADQLATALSNGTET